jgi:iron-sulfur cluster insertion protein
MAGFNANRTRSLFLTTSVQIFPRIKIALGSILYNSMITLTDNALTHLHELTKEHNKKYVRLQVKGGGCAGFEYEWSFADEDTRNDIVIHDILLIDRINELYIAGMQLDYKKEIFGSSFVFDNPMAKSSCGCGTSFAV